jgi:hypothetical protein
LFVVHILDLQRDLVVVQFIHIETSIMSYI